MIATHVQFVGGLAHVKGDRKQLLKDVQDYFNGDVPEPDDLFLHWTIINMMGKEEAIAVNPSQIVFIGRDHEMDPITPHLEPQGVLDVEVG